MRLNGRQSSGGTWVDCRDVQHCRLEFAPRRNRHVPDRIKIAKPGGIAAIAFRNRDSVKPRAARTTVTQL